MLDTKLKKMRNTKVLIILFTILIPAIVLVALYPRMGQVYNNQIKEIKAADEAANQAVLEEAAINNRAAYGLSSNFVNYAMEASYYLYGQMLQEARKTAVNFSMLDYYGWINDYYTLASDCEYYVEYNYIPEDGTPGRMIEKKESKHNLGAVFLEDQYAEKKALRNKLDSQGYLGYVILEFDEYGNLSDIRQEHFGEMSSNNNLYSKAKESIEQQFLLMPHYQLPYPALPQLPDMVFEFCPVPHMHYV